MADILKIAEAEVGYLEKESNKDLDPKVGPNVGDRNYTKYSRDLMKSVGKPFCNGVYWCVIFVIWCFVAAFGVELAKKLLHTWTMSCGELMRAFKAKGEFYTSKPKKGDLVIFEWTNKGTLHRHIGLVYKVANGYIYTIEGNTSCKSKGAEPNGGGVFKKSYSVGYSRIKGYCRPAYVTVAEPVLKRGKVNDPKQVKRLQYDLNQLGYKDRQKEELDLDGSFGRRTEEAVKAFQKANGLTVDGSYGPRTASMMMSIKVEEVL